MKHFICALSTGLAAASMADAGTIDFTSPTFASTFATVGTTPSTTSLIDGVLFTFTPTARGVNGFRQNASGLSFGVPGNGMYSLSISANVDVEITNITGFSSSVLTNAFGNPTGGVPFEVDYSAPGYGPFNIVYATVSSSVSLFGGGYDLTAGDTFLIDHFDNAGIFNQGVIESITFEASPVPLPAGGALMLAGLGAFGVMRSRKSVKT